MIRYRPFLNVDPPALADIWRTQPPLRGRLPAMTPALWEELVLARPYFDRNGLILAVDGARPIGFVHAGFGARDDLAGVDRSRGVICMLVVTPDAQQTDIATELVAAAEDYLRKGGATTFQAGAAFPGDPYYLGLYGGSGQPGWLASDVWIGNLFQALAYQPAEKHTLWQISTLDFQPPVDRTQMLVKRKYRVMAELDPPTIGWWRACTWGHVDRTRVDVLPRTAGPPLCCAWFWDMQPLASSWGIHAMGMARFEETAESRGQGLLTFLLSETIQEFRRQNISLLALQSPATDAELTSLLTKLGAQPYDEGVVYQKG